MKQNQFFVRYAISALRVAEDQSDEQFFKEIELLSASFLDNLKWSVFFGNPTVSDKEKIGLVRQTFSGSLSRTMEGFLMVLSQNKRLSFFLEIILVTFDRYKRSKGEAQAFLQVPKGLSEPQEQAILSKMSGLMNLKLDAFIQHSSTLIGGFFFSCDTYIYDATVHGVVEAFAKEQ